MTLYKICHLYAMDESNYLRQNGAMKEKQTQAKCPTCKKPFKAAEVDRTVFPFCSKRCKAVDLGKWIAEDYRIPSNEVTIPTDEENDES